jgi:hypothetical protein
VLVSDIRPTGTLSFTLDKLALQREDLYEGIALVEPMELNSIQLYNLMHYLGETEDLNDDFKEYFIDYGQTLLDFGFAYKWSMGDQDSNYQQEIDLFFTSDDAEQVMFQFPQMTIELLAITFEEIGAEIDIEFVDISTSNLGSDSYAFSLTMDFFGEQLFLHQVCVREKNLISVITIGSSTLTTSPHASETSYNTVSMNQNTIGKSSSTSQASSQYSGETIDDALSLSRKAIEKIRRTLSNRDLLVTNPETVRLIDMLKFIPAGVLKEDKGYLLMNDYATIRELFDVTIPATFTEEDIEEYMMSMYGHGDDFDYGSGMARGSFISGHNAYSVSTPIRTENVGYNLFNVDAGIQSFHSDNYSQTCAAIIGRFDPMATAAALDNRQEWPEAVKDSLTFEDYRGTKIYSWGNGDFGIENRMMPPILDNLGRALPFAVTLTNVFYSDTLENVKLMIDSSTSAEDSLLDMPEYYSAARGLSELCAYSGIIGNGSFVNGADFQRDESEAPLLKPYLAFGTGIGRDISGPYMALVLVHDSTDAALKNVDILIERINKTKWIRPVDWEDSWRLYVDYVQINSQENVLLAKLYGDRAQYIWERWLYENNPFLLYE